MSQGCFITLEGGEGAGKSRLAGGIVDALRAQGREVVQTREPGGAPGADEIRALLLGGGVERWSPLEEALLFATSRLNHLDHVIRPAIARGAWVVCDRYYDSTRAYQVAAGGVEPETLEALNAIINAPRPDLTLILDLDPVVGVARSRGAHVGEDRFEKKEAAFHERVRSAFLKIAEREPKRCALIDASQQPEAVLTASLHAIKERLG